MSLKPLDGMDLPALEDLYCIETLGELHDKQRRTTWAHGAAEEIHNMTLTVQGLRFQCGVGSFTESTRVEIPIARRRRRKRLDQNTSILSTLELCASVTLCTIGVRTPQRSSRTLVLRTSSRWHKCTIKHTERTTIGTGDVLLSHDPFRTEGSLQFNNVESKGSIYEALCTIRDLEAAAKTELRQEEISTLVSLFLLKAAVSSICNMTLSDHDMLLHPGESYMLNKEDDDFRGSIMIKVSDGCRAYLNDRCQRQRNAMRLSSAVAEKLHLAVVGSASSALISQVEQDLGHMEKTVSKIESQLQQTEKLLSTGIDQSFRALQITLAQTQLEESRKAIKQADTVARLTIVAFVFIPISAVCGFFGMNIIEVAAEGGFSFWVFGTTLGTVLAMTLLLAFADSICAMLTFYASNFDDMMYMNRNYPWKLLTYKIPYVFRLVSLNIRRKIASGRESRQATAMMTKHEVQHRGKVWINAVE